MCVGLSSGPVSLGIMGYDGHRKTRVTKTGCCEQKPHWVNGSISLKEFFFIGNEKNAVKYLKTSKNYPRKLYYLDFSRSLFDPQNSRPHETENSLHGFRKCFIWEPFHVWCNNNIIKSFLLTAADWNIIDKITWYPEFGPTYFDRCETNQG